MAKIQLKYGKDEKLRAMAKGIIEAQEKKRSRKWRSGRKANP